MGNQPWPQFQNGIRERSITAVKATFHLTISMRGQGATSKIQRTNYHHESCGAFLTRKTMWVFLIFMHGTHRNVKNRWSPKGGMVVNDHFITFLLLIHLN